MQEQEPINIALEIAKQVEQLPEQYRVDAFRVLLEHRLGIRPAEVQIETPGTHVVAEEISFSEFLNQVGELKTNQQRFAVVAYYYNRYRKESSVTQDDIINTISDAGLPPPKNFSRDMKAAMRPRNPLLMETKQTKNGSHAWQLTRTGRMFIEQKLSA